MFFSRARVMIVGEVLLHLGDRQAAEAVVGAEREDEDTHVPLERPVEPAKATGRRVAGHAGIHHLVGIAFLVELVLEEGRERLGLEESQPDGQAVAERHDLRADDGRRRIGGRRRARGRGRRLRADAEDEAAPARAAGARQKAGDEHNQGRQSQAGHRVWLLYRPGARARGSRPVLLLTP